MVDAIYEILLYDEYQELFMASKDEKFGVIDHKGEILIPCQCTKIQFTSQKGKIIISINDRWYLINLRKDTIQTPDLATHKNISTYDLPSYYCWTDKISISDYLYIREGDKMGVINISFKYSFSSDCCARGRSLSFPNLLYLRIIFKGTSSNRIFASTSDFYLFSRSHNHLRRYCQWSYNIYASNTCETLDSDNISNLF